MQRGVFKLRSCVQLRHHSNNNYNINFTFINIMTLLNFFQQPYITNRIILLSSHSINLVVKFYKDYNIFEMQALQDLKEKNDQRFDCIDKRWGQVEDALRLQQKERQGDVSILRERIQDRMSLSETLEKNKAKVLKDNLDKLHKEANESKQNLQQCFEYEADFRLTHLDKKNVFIQNFNNSGEEFVSRVHDYQDTKVKEISNRLECIDQNNREATSQTIRYLKEEKIGEARQFFDQQKSRFVDLLSKTRSDAARQVDQLRNSLRQYNKRREESDAKLQIMIGALGAQLSKMQEVQWKEGQITYDCLLKLVEDACAKIQQTQFK